MAKALIAMSGGVDSAVSAYLMQQAGYECIGCTMQLSPQTEGCGAAQDIADAKAVCDRLHMAHHVLDETDLFQNEIVGKFVRSYQCGRTPNPCIDCNRCMKFGAMMAAADALGCEILVTGHYARIVRKGSSWLLQTAADKDKDQSYVLYSLTQEKLARVQFPLGGLTKAQVRGIAAAQGFVNAHKHESQDICFVPDGDYAGFIMRQTGLQPVPGDFTDTAGQVIGRHQGLIHYTIGQRRGLGIALGKPAYVCELHPAENRVVIGENSDLFRCSCKVEDINWICGEIPAEAVRCSAKIRYRHPAQPALLRFTDEKTAVLTFDAPVRAITPGQSAVFYDGETVLGGGEIAASGCCRFAKGTEI